MNLIKAELLKLVYQRRNYLLLVAAIAISVLGAAFTPYALEKLSKAVVSMPLSTSDAVDSVYSKALAGYIFSAILGVLAISSEFSNHTAIATYLASPKRYQPLLAKILVVGVAGAVWNLVATWAGMGSAAYALTFYKHADPSSSIWLDLSAAAVLSGAILALIGVGIGSLIRNQNAAVGVTMVWLFLVDRILAVVFVDIGKYLPTGLITSLMNLKLNLNQGTLKINTSDYLEPWPAAGLLTLYGVVFVVASLVTTTRRDID